ncbi:MAG: polysaccharide deacetylase family protein [Actinomycetota bacterium]
MRVALTFDAEHPDRPGCPPGVHDRVLEALAPETPATFFLQGRWAQAYPDAARRIADAGHVIGSHSHFHARFPLLTDEGLRADITQAHRAIREATGVDPRPLFRCPWGHGARDPRVALALRRQRYVHVGWDVVAQDWEPSRTAARVAEDVVRGAAAFGDGAVLLLHSWSISALEALPTILGRLRESEARFVTVAELADRDLTTTANPDTASENPA